MSSSNKSKKQKRQIKYREIAKIDPPNQTILDSIGSPNAWTPKLEDTWLNELKKITAVEIYRRFPPMKKPGNVSKRGKSYGG